MNKRRPLLFKSILLLVFLLLIQGANAQKVKISKSNLLPLIDKSLQESSEQYQFLMKQAPETTLPRSFEKGKLKATASDDWVSGFYPGTLFYLYEYSRKEELLKEALQRLKLLEKEQFNTSTHDLGFMMYCSFGNANKIQLKPTYKDIMLNSVWSLSSRFNSQVGCIRSWNPGQANSDSSDYLVIIDNMMNLELLFWATKVSGDSSFYKIALDHANTTMKNHFRPDYSSYHVVNYNPTTGSVQKRRTQQGLADESAWARGQAWGLYGFTLMYRETKDPKYLKQAENIANFILNHPNLPADKIPYWDFDAPTGPTTPRDASAGAIISSALIELSGYTKGKPSKKYLSTAEKMLHSLSSPAFRASYGENGGFLLKHSVGSFPHGGEVDVPLNYTDYYYVEAMLRYRNLNR